MRNHHIPWLAMTWVGGMGFALLVAPVLQAHSALLPHCPFKSLTGLPCATCGGTRFLVALAHRQYWEALYWHPALATLVCLSPVAAVWDLRRAWRGETYPSLPQGRWPRAAAGASLLAAWLLQIVRGM